MMLLTSRIGWYILYLVKEGAIATILNDHRYRLYSLLSISGFRTSA